MTAPVPLSADYLSTFQSPHFGVLVQRYKRFLADVRLDNGEVVTAHCTNTGSMKGVCVPGERVLLSHNPAPHRKLHWTWEATRLPELPQGDWVGINTAQPNRVVKEALSRGLITALADAGTVKAEIKIDAHTRLDFVLTHPKTGRKTFVEVKNVTLTDGGSAKGRTALFPDSVSERALKHLDTLERLAGQGHRACVFFVTQRQDCTAVAAAGDIDPDYAAGLTRVCARGVEALAYSFIVDEKGIRLGAPLPVRT